MLETAEVKFQGLFRHRTREDWGVGVLSGERDGKRTYLFEHGEERVMGRGPLDMMTPIASLTDSQRGTRARLIAVVANRSGVPDPATAAGAVVLKQITLLRGAFPRGFADPAWESEKRAAPARDTSVARARELLAAEALDKHLNAQHFARVWAAASEVLGASGWLAADQLKLVPTFAPGLLASAVRELLHGSTTLEQRVERFSVAFETALRQSPRWEATSGLLALFSPDSHVLVDLASFRRQFKLLGYEGTLSNNPSGAGYVRCLNVARIVASKLTEHGEAPRDLLDVHDFIRFTCKASARALRPNAAKASKKRGRSVEPQEARDSK